MTGKHKEKTISRRRALAVTGGTVAAGGLAVAGYQSASADTTDTATAAQATASASAASGTCVLMSSVTEGPYYLDGALVRKDITEGKSGVPLTLRITVQDTTAKADGTYEGGKVNYTGQLFFADEVAEEVFTLDPYSKHTGTYTALASDMVYDGGGAASGLLTLKPVHKKDPSKGYKGFITLGVDPDAENTGASSGSGGTPPSGAPSGAPTGTVPSGSPSPSATASS